MRLLGLNSSSLLLAVLLIACVGSHVLMMFGMRGHKGSKDGEAGGGAGGSHAGHGGGGCCGGGTDAAPKDESAETPAKVG